MSKQLSILESLKLNRINEFKVEKGEVPDINDIGNRPSINTEAEDIKPEDTKTENAIGKDEKLINIPKKDQKILSELLKIEGCAIKSVIDDNFGIRVLLTIKRLPNRIFKFSDTRKGQYYRLYDHSYSNGIIGGLVSSEIYPKN